MTTSPMTTSEGQGIAFIMHVELVEDLPESQVRSIKHAIDLLCGVDGVEILWTVRPHEDAKSTEATSDSLDCDQASR